MEEEKKETEQLSIEQTERIKQLEAALKARASLVSSGYFSSLRYLMIGVIQLSPSSSTTALISFISVDGFSNTSTNISLMGQLNATEANLLKTSAFWF
ncbi:hypothetical protein Tco_0532189 [Tanacetum coccineum]